jgi:hypothetical protein
MDPAPSTGFLSDSIDLTVATPPANADFLQDSASSLQSSVIAKRVSTRAELFIQGRYDALVRDMEKDEIR